MSIIRFHGDRKILVGISVGISLANDDDLYVEEDPKESADGTEYIPVIEDRGQDDLRPVDYRVTDEGDYTRFDSDCPCED